MNLNLFVNEYLVCALWADLPEENMHDGLTLENIAKESYHKAFHDCARFIEQNIDDVTSAVEAMSIGHVAHDFWLTRNGHGAGFWDGDYTEKLGERLTVAAQKFGEADLYIGDDGWIYIS
jgi:hypothetical protein